jgi:hypothetical protein
MSNVRKATFVVWAILTLVVGAALLLAPGRFLGWFGWAPVEPILSRLLGAALLALSWLALRGYVSADRAPAALVAEVQLAFCALGAVGVLRHLTVPAYWPPMVWGLFVVLLVFAGLWLLVLITGAARR